MGSPGELALAVIPYESRRSWAQRRGNNGPSSPESTAPPSSPREAVTKAPSPLLPSYMTLDNHLTSQCQPPPAPRKGDNNVQIAGV